jgi:(p)ppGpp synthase/HD superfamily hydrolase
MTTRCRGFSLWNGTPRVCQITNVGPARSPGWGPRRIVSEVSPSTASLEDALVFAVEAHRGQRYPSPEAEPYIFHPLRMMIEFFDLVDQMAAVLHDVVEDTDREICDLVDSGFPMNVVTAIDCLTHRSNESYDDYIERLSVNDVARRVKIIDLRLNLANNRRLPDSGQTTERIARYEKALARLGAIL